MKLIDEVELVNKVVESGKREEQHDGTGRVICNMYSVPL